MRIIDLTCPLELGDKIPTFLSKVGSYKSTMLTSAQREGWMVCLLTMQTHQATHIDAPMHVFERHNKKGIFAVDDWPLEQLYGETVVLDIPRGELGEITADDLEKARPEVKAGDIVLVHTGWGRFYIEDRKTSKYVTERRPGLVTSAAEWLVKKKVKAIGSDTTVINHPGPNVIPSAEERARGAVPYDPVHKTLLGNDIVIIEQLMNLDKIKGQRVTCGFFPLRIVGLDGSPCRALAFVN